MRRVPLAVFLLSALTAHALDFDIDEMLAAHNHWRKAVSVPPLVYSTGLAASAQDWANHLKDSNQCKMRHSDPKSMYGENLYWASALKWSDGKRELQQVDPRQVVDNWAGERADYDYSGNSCRKGKMCGHYTQVVWNTTSMVGCAVAVCEDSREQVWVCQYQQPGNWIGKRPY